MCHNNVSQKPGHSSSKAYRLELPIVLSIRMETPREATQLVRCGHCHDLKPEHVGARHISNHHTVMASACHP